MNRCKKKTGESPQLIAFNAANANNVDVCIATIIKNGNLRTCHFI